MCATPIDVDINPGAQFSLNWALRKNFPDGWGQVAAVVYDTWQFADDNGKDATDHSRDQVHGAGIQVGIPRYGLTLKYMHEFGAETRFEGQMITLAFGLPLDVIVNKLGAPPPLGAASPRTAAVLMVLTWPPLFVLALVGGVAFWGAQIPFVKDLAAHTRFLFALPILVLADIPIGTRLPGTPGCSMTSGFTESRCTATSCWAPATFNRWRLGGSFDRVRSMRVVPIDLQDIIGIVIPAALPALPLLATVMPVADIVKTLLRLLG